MAAGSASAAVTWYAGGTSFEDDNVDWHYLDVNKNDRIDVSDQLYSVVEIVRTTGTTVGGSTDITGGELTGVSIIEVASKTVVRSLATTRLLRPPPPAG